MFLSGALCTQHACVRYANGHSDPPTVEESRRNVYLSKI